MEGVVKEKKEALNNYDDGISSGHGAYLGQVKKTQEGTNFEISVGNLPPQKSVEVFVDLYQILPTEGGDMAFIIQPELFPKVSYEYTAKLSVKVKLSKGIGEIFVLGNEKIAIEKDEHNASFHHDINFWNDLKQDFVLVMRPAEAFTPMAIGEKNEKDKSLAMMVNFYPSYDHIDEDLLEPRSEILFVVDRSGSMSGSRMRSVKEVLSIFLQSIPPTCKFNIIGFGSKFKNLFPNSVDYDDNTLKEAQNHCKSLEANLGGTELMPVLQYVFAQPYDPQFPRQLFILTDGDISETQQTIDLTAKEAGTTRVFTLGIGTGASRPLVYGLARAGRGMAEFVEDNDSTLKTKVLAMLQCAMEPMLRDCRIEWPEKSLSAESCFQSPGRLRALFNGEKLVACALLKGVEQIPPSITVKFVAKGPDGVDFSKDIQVQISDAQEGLIHKIAAYGVCKDLIDETSFMHVDKKADKELKKKAKSLVIELGVKYQIATKHTSYVAVEEREELTEGSMIPQTVEMKKKQHNTSLKKGAPSRMIDSMVMKKGAPSRMIDSMVTMERSAPVKNVKKEKKSSGGFFFSLFQSKDKSQEEPKKLSKKLSKEKMSQSGEKKSNQPESESLSTFSTNTATINTASKRMMKKPSPVPPAAPAAQSSTLPAPRTTKANDTEIVLAQKAAGFWELSQVASLLQLDLSKLSSSNPASSSTLSEEVKSQLWATAVVIAFLNKFFAASKAVWQLVESKARSFLKKTQNKNSLNDIDFASFADKFVSSL